MEQELYEQTVNEVNARLTMLDLEVMQRIKSKGLTPKDVRLIWSQSLDNTFVTVHYENGTYPDETIKF